MSMQLSFYLKFSDKEYFVVCRSKTVPIPGKYELQCDGDGKSMFGLIRRPANSLGQIDDTP